MKVMFFQVLSWTMKAQNALVQAIPEHHQSSAPLVAMLCVEASSGKVQWSHMVQLLQLEPAAPCEGFFQRWTTCWRGNWHCWCWYSMIPHHCSCYGLLHGAQSHDHIFQETRLWSSSDDTLPTGRGGLETWIGQTFKNWCSLCKGLLYRICLDPRLNFHIQRNSFSTK